MPSDHPERSEPGRVACWDGEEAWKNALRVSVSRWVAEKGTKHWAQSAGARLESAIVLPEPAPTFRLTREAPIFTIGSCFARNIENHLFGRGFRVATRPVNAPGLEPGRDSSFILNKFTTHSMLNELRWALRDDCPFPEESIVEEKEGGWTDLQLVPAVPPAEREVVLSRRPYLRDLYRRVIGCRVVILTLGLVEAWHDDEAGVYLNRAPGYWVVKRYPGRFSLHVLDYRSNREALEEIRSLLVSACGPELRMVVTVSPVPMTETFTGGDILVANSFSKSTLRAVAGDFARAHADVDYFPSYEAVALSDRRLAFEADLNHIASPMVEMIVSRFLEAYAEGYAPERGGPSAMVEQRMAARAGDLEAENAALRVQLAEAKRELDDARRGRELARFDGIWELSPDGLARASDGRLVPRSSSLTGSAEVGERSGSELMVSGWAVDRADLEGPAGVAVFVDGLRRCATLTSIPRADIDRFLGAPARVPGFRVTFSLRAGEEPRSVRVFAVSAAGAAAELSYFELFRLPRG